MNTLIGKRNIESVINCILRDVEQIFSSNLTEENRNYLSFFLEDILVSKAAFSNDEVVNVFDNEMVNELNAALVASGVATSETMPEEYFNRKLAMLNDTNTRAFTKDYIYKQYILLIDKIISYNPNPEPTTTDEIPRYAVSLMQNLVECGLGCSEIDSGFLNADRAFVYYGIQYANYLQAMDFYTRHSLNDSLACDICHSIYKPKKAPIHYSEVVKCALKLMSTTDMMIHVYGPGFPLQSENIEVTLRAAEAAKLLDNELIEPLLKRFNEIIAPIQDGTPVSAQPTEARQRRFRRGSNIISFPLRNPE